MSEAEIISLLKEISAKLDARAESVPARKAAGTKRVSYEGDEIWDERMKALVHGIVTNGFVGILEARNSSALRGISAPSRFRDSYERHFEKKFASADEKHQLCYFELTDGRAIFPFVTFKGYLHCALGMALDRVFGPVTQPVNPDVYLTKDQLEARRYEESLEEEGIRFKRSERQRVKKAEFENAEKETERRKNERRNAAKM